MESGLERGESNGGLRSQVEAHLSIGVFIPISTIYKIITNVVMGDRVSKMYYTKRVCWSYFSAHPVGSKEWHLSEN